MSAIASLFNLGWPDLVIILAIVLLLFGANKFSELGRGMAQAVREISKAEGEFKMDGLDWLVVAVMVLLLLLATGLIIFRG